MSDRAKALRSSRRRFGLIACAALALLTFVGWAALSSGAARAKPLSASHSRSTSLPLPVRVGHGFTKPWRPPTPTECKRVVHLACYSALLLQKAYGMGALYRKGLTGKGRTIVIVDPFGSPTIRHDLSVYDRAFGLRPPPTFRIIQPVGRVPPYDPDNQAMVDKAGETTGDVEAAHAMAPGANILLVETPTAETIEGGGFPKMIKAESYVIKRNLGDVISQSFSLPEQNFPRGAISALRYAYRDALKRHVSVLAASNDFGVAGVSRQNSFYKHRVVYWPASDPLVTAVGGTRLHLDRHGQRTSPDTVWNDSHSLAVEKYVGLDPLAGNGGLSLHFSRPAYQDSVRRIVGDRRGVPDISLSASFTGGVLVYASYRVGSYQGTPGWLIGGGTSAATPEFAGIVAIADQSAKRRLGLLNPLLYRLAQRHARGIVDITKGNNTVSFPVVVGTKVKTFTLKGYRAMRGYDLAAGLGTVNAARLVPELAGS